MATKSKTMRNKKTGELTTVISYGGYVNWLNGQGELEEREVKVWGPTRWDPTYYGDGSQIFAAVNKKARKRWKNAECREIWIY